MALKKITSFAKFNYFGRFQNLFAVVFHYLYPPNIRDRVWNRTFQRIYKVDSNLPLYRAFVARNW
jgi:hypothetical protein